MSLPARPRWLWRYLWGWTLLVLLLTYGGLAGVAYLTGLHEAREITDGHLSAAAQLLLRVKALSAGGPPGVATGASDAEPMPDRYATDLHVVAWENGRLTWDTHAMAERLPPTLVDGHHTLVLAADDGGVRTWRLYARTETDAAGATRRVAVLTDTARHAALAWDMAEHIVRPVIVLFPLAALLLIWAIRRGLRPLNRLAAEMAALDVRAGQRLQGQQAFVELASTVQAIHHLVDQLHQQWERERQFNADVAHELRTPLTSAVLQAHVAQHAETPAQREQALRQVQADALRAAAILTQLLELARAQRGASARHQPVDLCELARQACASHQTQAHEAGQSLTLQAPPAPVWVDGNGPLLALALRNLVDNALRHNPRGTQVEIAVRHHADGSRVLSVNDDGRFQPEGSARPGMGIGLTLVRRIADAHGAALRHEAANAPYTTRFALVWPAPGAR